MAADPDTSDVAGDGVLDDVWATADGDTTAADEDCGPTKVCRNAREFSFEGISEGGGDLASAWRNLLQAEGKLADGGSPIRDLVLGDADD